MMGNGTYGLSVMLVLPALRGSKKTFVVNHLAWLIGSMGVLVLDFFVSLKETPLQIQVMTLVVNKKKKNTDLKTV